MTKNTISQMAAIAALIFFNIFAFSRLAVAQFGGGSGTDYDPYLINNTDQLDQLAADVNNGNTYENVWFKLMDDLDYTNKTYTPIGRVYYDGTNFVERRFCGGFFRQQPLHQQLDYQQPR